MNITINTIKGDKDINIEYSSMYKGRGQWNIVCEVNNKIGNTIYRTDLYVHTTDSQFIDKISDMIDEDQSHEDIEEEYHNKFFSSFEESIQEFVCRYEIIN